MAKTDADQALKKWRSTISIKGRRDKENDGEQVADRDAQRR